MKIHPRRRAPRVAALALLSSVLALAALQAPACTPADMHLNCFSDQGTVWSCLIMYQEHSCGCHISPLPEEIPWNACAFNLADARVKVENDYVMRVLDKTKSRGSYTLNVDECTNTGLDSFDPSNPDWSIGAHRPPPVAHKPLPVAVLKLGGSAVLSVAPSPPDVPLDGDACSAFSGEDGCASCAQGSCCYNLEDCLTDDNCSCLAACLYVDGDVSGCVDSCGTPDGVALQFAQCLESNCGGCMDVEDTCTCDDGTGGGSGAGGAGGGSGEGGDTGNGGDSTSTAGAGASSSDTTTTVTVGAGGDGCGERHLPHGLGGAGGARW
jgi:uncharacterized membrane protein YgcG